MSCLLFFFFAKLVLRLLSWGLLIISLSFAVMIATWVCNGVEVYQGVPWCAFSSLRAEQRNLCIVCKQEKNLLSGTSPWSSPFVTQYCFGGD